MLNWNAYIFCQVWALKAGFSIAKDLEELRDDKYSMRFILAYPVGVGDISLSNVCQPNPVLIMGETIFF